MFNPEETAADLKKHFNKLESVINNQCIFTLLDTKVVKKNLIDDILCCVEASFPDEYKQYIKLHGETKIQSSSLYRNLKNNIQNRFMFSSSHYAVKFKNTSRLIYSLIKAINSDLRIIAESA